MELKSKSNKNCHAPKIKTILSFLNYCEFGESLSDTINLTKFETISNFARDFVNSHDKNEDLSQPFRFTLVMEDDEKNALTAYLSKHKDFVIQHIVSKGYFFKFPFISIVSSIFTL